MKKTMFLMAVIFVSIISISTKAQAADVSCYIVPGSGHSFGLDLANGGTLFIWGGNIPTVTGLNTLSANVADVPLSVIQSWMGVLTAFRITEESVRVIYDNTNGKIKRIGPQQI